MSKELLNLLIALLPLLGTLAALAAWGIRQFKPLIVAKVGKDNYERIVAVAGVLVKSIEQQTKVSGAGEQKKQAVAMMISEKFPGLSQGEIDHLIESAVFEMNKGKEKIITEVTSTDTTPLPAPVPALTPEQIQNIAAASGQAIAAAITQVVNVNGQV